jgi:hypothetical protein
MLPVGVMTGDYYGFFYYSEEQNTACSRVYIQFVEIIFRNYPMNVKVQPDRYANLMEQAHSPEFHGNVTGQ